jgi:hypothetical protein
VGRNDLEDVELQIAHQRIHHGAGSLSKLILPIDPRTDPSS